MRPRTTNGNARSASVALSISDCWFCGSGSEWCWARHALQKLFGWWGGQGVTGFKNSLSDAGYQHADILAYVSAGGELVAAVLLVLGLFTPIAAAGALAFLINGLLATISAQPHSHSSRSSCRTDTSTR